MDPELVRSILLIVIAAGVGLAAGGVRGLPHFWQAREQEIYHRLARQDAITTALEDIPKLRVEVQTAVSMVSNAVEGLSERMKALEHEVVPNGDPLDEGRPMRQVLRYQGGQLIAQTGMINAIQEQLAQGARRFDRIDERLERVELRELGAEGIKQ